MLSSGGEFGWEVSGASAPWRFLQLQREKAVPHTHTSCISNTKTTDGYQTAHRLLSLPLSVPSDDERKLAGPLQSGLPQLPQHAIQGVESVFSPSKYCSPDPTVSAAYHMIRIKLCVCVRWRSKRRIPTVFFRQLRFHCRDSTSQWRPSFSPPQWCGRTRCSSTGTRSYTRARVCHCE